MYDNIFRFSSVRSDMFNMHCSTSSANVKEHISKNVVLNSTRSCINFLCGFRANSQVTYASLITCHIGYTTILQYICILQKSINILWFAEDRRTLNKILPVGNLAHGQAFSHYCGYLQHILPGKLLPNTSNKQY